MAKQCVSGQDQIPHSPSLFLPNRINLETLKLIDKTLGGASKLAFLIEDVLLPSPAILRITQQKGRKYISFNFRQAQVLKLREQIMSLLNQGYHILFVPGVPEGPIGRISDIPMPFMMQLSALHISPVPVFVGMYRNKLAQLFNTEDDYNILHLDFCGKLASGPYMGDRLLQAWMQASERCYRKSPVIYRSVARLLVEGMKHNPKAGLVDGLDETELPYGKMLGVVLALSRKLKTIVQEARVGLILPPGKGGIIANYACIIAGIIPVNINFTAPESAFKSIIKQSGIKKFITAKAFMNKLPQFPWPAEDTIIHLDKTLKAMGMAGIAPWVAFAKISPLSVISKVFNLDARKGSDEAALIFTSGSSGDPKGVSFTHSMIVANITQLLSRIKLPSNSTLLGSLPLFHSFGLTVTTLAPAILGLKLVSYPSPLDAKRLNELIEKYECNMAISTPTFARAMLRRADADTFRSIKYFLVGAEKLQQDLAEEYKTRCNITLLDAYGLTETTPGCCFNLPPEQYPSDRYYIPGRSAKGIGAILPGLAARITDPDNDDIDLPLSEQGMIWFKGPNVVKRYVGNEELNKEAFRDGWFKTGDLGHIDLNGMLHLGGRRSRFSKIGGEMVPHELIEQAIEAMLTEANGLSEVRRIAIVGVPDKQKGEAIVLLSSVHHTDLPKSLSNIRGYLVEKGLPRLWTPREILPVELVPMLATGKVDLKSCKMLAYESLGLMI